MRDPDEVITAVHATSASFLLGTSLNDIVVIQPHGAPLSSELRAHRLVQRSSIFVDVFKLLGFASDHTPSDPVSKILTVPGTLWLLQCGDHLRLWEGWAEAGREQLVWTAGLKELLVADSSDALNSSAGELRVHDFALLPFSGQSVVTLAVVFSVGGTHDSDATLYVHIIDASLTADSMPLTTKARVAVDSMTETTFAPILIEGTSWRVTIAWSSAVSHTLHTLTLDVHCARMLAKTIDLSSDISEFDVDIETPQLTAVNSVAGDEGVFILTRDCLLYNHTPMFVDVENPPRTIVQSMNLMDYIRGICMGQVRLARFHLILKHFP